MLNPQTALPAVGPNPFTQVDPASLAAVLLHIKEGYGQIYEQINNLPGAACIMSVSILIEQAFIYWLCPPNTITLATNTVSAVVHVFLLCKEIPPLLSMAKAQEKYVCDILTETEREARKLAEVIKETDSFVEFPSESLSLEPARLKIKEGHGKIYEQIKNLSGTFILTIVGVGISYFCVPFIIKFITSALAAGAVAGGVPMAVGTGLCLKNISSLLPMVKAQEKYAYDTIVEANREITQMLRQIQ